MSIANESLKSFNDSITNYKLIEIINKGGMSDIYLAEDTRLKRHVAIKFIKDNDSDDKLSEAQFLARLNHQNIVQIYDVLTFENYICIVMEYFKGKTLYQHQKQNILNLSQKLEILVDICQGMSHAHNAGILHCDLKASNILVSAGSVKIIDYGISKASVIKGGKDDSGVVFGSMTTMSPEQIRNEKLDIKTDLFSFGILAFELLSNQHPFGNGEKEEVFNAILSKDAPDPANLAPDISEELSKLIIDLLEKDKKKRPADFSEVLNKLKAFSFKNNYKDELEVLTEAFTPVEKDNSRKNIKVISFFSFIVISCLSAFIYYNLPEEEEINVSVLPATMNIGSYFNANEGLVSAAIDESIRQNVVNIKGLDLIHRNELGSLLSNDNVEAITKKQLDNIRAITGSDEIIIPSLDCQLEQCSLLLERLGGPNWAVLEQNRWPVIIDDYSYIYSSVGQQVDALFSELDDKYLVSQEESNEFFEDHLNLYKEIAVSEHYTENNFNALVSLIETYPDFYANYDLLEELSVGLYVDSDNLKYLEEAKKIFINSPLVYQETPFFHYNMANLYINSSDWDKSKFYIEKAKSLGLSKSSANDLEGMLLFRQDNLDEAEKVFRVSLKLRGSNKVKETLASILWRRGEVEESKKLLNEVVLSSPDSYVANQMLADMALFEGNLDLAIDRYLKAIKIMPNGGDLSYLSIAYSLNEEYEKAYLSAKEAVNFAPDNDIYILNLADMEKANGLMKDAEKNYNKIIRNSLNSRSLDEILNASQAYAQLGNAKEALKALNNAIIISPNDKEYVFTAALVYTLVEEYHSALVYIEKSMESGYGPVWFKLPWFRSLCKKEEFIDILKQYNSPFECSMPSV